MGVVNKELIRKGMELEVARRCGSVDRRVLTKNTMNS
jgi:hypothetical protein